MDIILEQMTNDKTELRSFLISQVIREKDKQQRMYLDRVMGLLIRSKECRNSGPWLFIWWRIVLETIKTSFNNSII